MRQRLLPMLGLVAALAAGQALAAAAPPQVLLGRVKSISADSLSLTVNGKTETVGFSPRLNVYLLKPTTPDQIKPGSFIGTTNIPSGKGAGRSTEVHIFPPGVKGGEGDRPWPSSGPAPAASSMMTNGTVSAPAAPAASAMTGGSVKALGKGAAGLSFDVVYPGGTKRVTVPPGTQITTMNPGKVTDIRAGNRVTVIAATGPDGKRQATLINVEPVGK